MIWTGVWPSMKRGRGPDIPEAVAVPARIPRDLPEQGGGRQTRNRDQSLGQGTQASAVHVVKHGTDALTSGVLQSEQSCTHVETHEATLLERFQHTLPRIGGDPIGQSD